MLLSFYVTLALQFKLYYIQAGHAKLLHPKITLQRNHFS